MIVFWKNLLAYSYLNMKNRSRLIIAKSQIFLSKVLLQSYDTHEIYCAWFNIRKMFISSFFINFILKIKNNKKRIKTQSLHWALFSVWAVLSAF